jgi:hypothetical protein
MIAPRKGPVSWQGQPTQNIFSLQKRRLLNAPSAQFWQAVLGGIIGADIAFLALNAPAVAHVIAAWVRP